MPIDPVAIMVDVSGPQVTPPGSPIEKYINITPVIDTSEFDEDQEVVAYIGDNFNRRILPFNLKKGAFSQ